MVTQEHQIEEQSWTEQAGGGLTVPPSFPWLSCSYILLLLSDFLLSYSPPGTPTGKKAAWKKRVVLGSHREWLPRAQNEQQQQQQEKCHDGGAGARMKWWSLRSVPGNANSPRSIQLKAKVFGWDLIGSVGMTAQGHSRQARRQKQKYFMPLLLSGLCAFSMCVCYHYANTKLISV